MKRAVILTTIALSTAGLAACGSSEDKGQEVGKSIASLTTTVMTRPAAFHMEGIEAQIKSLQSDVSKETFEQLERAEIRLQEQVTKAENHPDKLHAAAEAGVAAFTSITGEGDTIEQFKQGVKKGYDEGVN
ncbi:MAG: hypothetical protein PGN13_08490 [Patulibacter minatonensis]